MLLQEHNGRLDCNLSNQGDTINYFLSTFLKIIDVEKKDIKKKSKKYHYFFSSGFVLSSTIPNLDNCL